MVVTVELYKGVACLHTGSWFFSLTAELFNLLPISTGPVGMCLRYSVINPGSWFIETVNLEVEKKKKKKKKKKKN